MRDSPYKKAAAACNISSFTQAITINLAPVLFTVFRDAYSLTFEQLGRLVFICFGTQIIVDIIAIKVADKVGYRACAVAAQAFIAIGLAMLGLLPLIAPGYFALVISVIVYSAGSGLIEVIISPIVDAIPSDAKASDMAFTHAFYCWGQLSTVLLSTAALALVGHSRWFILPIAWSIIPAFNFINFIRIPLPPPPSGGNPMPLRTLFKQKTLLFSLALMVCVGASELSMSQWSSLFAERALGIPKVAGDILGPCLFALMMGIGRTFYGVFGKNIRILPALLTSAGFSAVCYLVAALSGSAVLSMIGCVLCGLAVSLMWPGTLSRASRKLPSGGTAMFALCALFGDFGCSLGPYLTGAVADAVPAAGLRAGLAAGAVFPAVMFVLLLFALPRKKSRTEG